MTRNHLLALAMACAVAAIAIRTEDKDTIKEGLAFAGLIVAGLYGHMQVHRAARRADDPPPAPPPDKPPAP